MRNKDGDCIEKPRSESNQREAAEMLHNISLYPGLTEDQLCRFFPEKEAIGKDFAFPYAERGPHLQRRE